MARPKAQSGTEPAQQWVLFYGGGSVRLLHGVQRLKTVIVICDGHIWSICCSSYLQQSCNILENLLKWRSDLVVCIYVGNKLVHVKKKLTAQMLLRILLKDSPDNSLRADRVEFPEKFIWVVFMADLVIRNHGSASQLAMALTSAGIASHATVVTCAWWWWHACRMWSNGYVYPAYGHQKESSRLGMSATSSNTLRR